MTQPDTVHLATLPDMAPLGEETPVLAYPIAGKHLVTHLLERAAARHDGPLKIEVSDPALLVRTDLLDAAKAYGNVERTHEAGGPVRFPQAAGDDVTLRYVWNLHDAVAEVLSGLAPGIASGATVERDVQIDGTVVVEAGARVLGGARLKGNVFVGAGALVGNGALVRGNSHIGRDSMIGFAVELKSSLLLDRTVVGPASAVTDSVLEEESFLGGLVRISNTQLGFRPVSVVVDGQRVESDRKFLGASIGAGAKLGGGVRVSPGRSIGSHSEVGPGVNVIRNVAARTRVRLEQNLTVEALEP